MQCMCIQMKSWLHVDLPWMHWSVHQPSQRWDPHCKQLPVEMTRLHSWWRQCQTSMLLCTWNHSCTGIANVHVHECMSVDALHEHNCLSLSDSLSLSLFLSLSLSHTHTHTHTNSQFGLAILLQLIMTEIGFAYPSHIRIAALWIDAIIGDDVLESLTYSATTAAIVTKGNCIDRVNNIMWVNDIP